MSSGNEMYVSNTAVIPLLETPISLTASTVDEFKIELDRATRSALRPTNGTSFRQFLTLLCNVVVIGWKRS